MNAPDGSKGRQVSMKKAIKLYSNVTAKICYYVCFISMILIAAMMLIMFVDSMLGLFANYRITGIYELVQCLLLIVVFTSWAYTQTVHGHIHVTMFVGKMPQKLRFICFSLTSLISVITMVFATWGVGKGIMEKIASHEITATLMIPIWPLFVVECVVFALFALVLLGDTVKSFIAIFDKEFADDVQSSWT